MTKTFLEDQKITKVYHIADLHIRNLKRHKEYKTVFTRFLREVKKNNLDDAIIYIGGDIAHAKTEMSPELVHMISWFLGSCAKLHPTFVITGNHDCNQNNPHRMDVLTPIIDNIQSENLHYLRDTGVYEIGDLTVGVYSIFDDKENWPKGTEIEGDNKICLFHGPVDKTMTDIGYEVSSRSFTVPIFDGYHIAMLGDIHKRQVAQQYDEENGKPIIVYCGSLIQQNHGELLENHGYLLWDIPTRTFTEHDIHNDYGYLTIDIESNVIPQWVYDELNTKLPKRPRLRVRFANTEPSDVKLRLAELQSMFKTSEVTFTRTDTLSQLKSGMQLNDNIVGNVKDITFQNKLIHEYLLTNYLMDEDDISKVIEINNELNNELTKEADVIDNNIVWYPQTFEFSNMFSYGEDNKIRFPKLKGLMGLFAANTSGKSSIFDALSFCMFDKCSRTFKAEKILNNRKEDFTCKFEFIIDEETFFIERRAKTVRKGKAVKVDVDFWKIDSVGEEVSLNGEQRRDTNKVIEQYLGTYDDFILTALSIQGNNALFIDKSQTERKDVLSQFIGADVFDKLFNVANEKNKESLTLIKKFKNDDFSEQLATLVSNIKTKTKEYRDTKTHLKNLRSEEETLQQRVEELSEQLITLDDNLDSIDKLKENKENIKKNLKKLESNLTELKETIVILENDLKPLESERDGYVKDKLEDNVKSYNKLKESLKSKNHEQEKLQLKIESQKERIDSVIDYEYDEECEYCVTNAEHVIHVRDDANSKLVDLNLEFSKLSDEIDEIENQISSYGKIDQDWKRFGTLNQQISKLSSELHRERERKLNLENEILKTRDKYNKSDELVGKYYRYEKDFKFNQELKEEISEYKDELISLKDEITETNDELLEVNGDLSTLKSHKQTLVERIEEVKDLEDYHKLLEFYLEAVKRDGIPYDLITKAIPAIEGEINNILGQVVDFTMQLEVDGKNINANINYDDQTWPLEMCSGMERFISGLAIRVGLINVCNLPRPNFLVIDEGLGTLDSENLQSVFLLFNYLKTQFDFVVLISHLETSRDFVDGLIEIKKVDGFSSVKV